MRSHAETLRTLLASGPRTPRQVIEKMGVSQPTLSRAVAELGSEIVRIGAARSIQYALRDTQRGLPEMAVQRVDAAGQISLLGTLIPVRPEGFVILTADGKTLHSDGLPWWMADMRPAGYLGRAYAARYAADLGLPLRLNDWSDTQALRALLAHGHDLIGNLLIGELAREQFLTSPLPEPITVQQKVEAYPRLAQEAAQGERPGSSAGGEQPKFTARAVTRKSPGSPKTFAAPLGGGLPEEQAGGSPLRGAQYVIVKFSEREDSPVSERWRDILLAEHLALATLREAGIPAAHTQLVDAAGQRFLEVERFDRVGELGRHALHSLAMLDAEFIGAGTEAWPAITRRLAEASIVQQDDVIGAALLWAFGNLIGNTDMHNGNLSFTGDAGAPYALAPAYDMSPMAFAPRSGGGLPDSLPAASIRADVANDIWRQAEALARSFLDRVKAAEGFSQRFAPCVAGLEAHVEQAAQKIARLG